MAIKKINIEVEGMTCAACSSRVEKALNKRQGVSSGVVNLLANKATVEFDEGVVSPYEIVKTIEKSGYDVPLVKKTLLVEGMT